MSTRSYTQFNDEAQMQNYRRNKKGVPVDYSVDVQRPRFLFSWREVIAQAGTGVSLDTGVSIEFAAEGTGANGSICV